MFRLNSCFLKVVSFCTLIAFFCQCKNTTESAELISIGNGKIKLGFEKTSGKLIRFSDMVNPWEFIDENTVKGFPWEINFHQPSTDLPVTDKLIPSKFSFSKPNPLSLVLTWENFQEIESLKIIVKVSLDKDKALSYWNIETEGHKGLKMENLVFPKIEGIRDMGNEELALPTWMGSLIRSPRSYFSDSAVKSNEFISSYPGYFSMQVLALYNPDKIGFYASCNDSLSYSKDFSIALDSLNTLKYRIVNYPNFTSDVDTYSLPYDAVVGSFKGDWITAAKEYKEWAIKQKWSKNSRLKNRLTSPWLNNTALWVWNRGKSDNVLTPAIELKKKLGLPVSVFWHWWHNCSYDDFFPEYLPPREGKQSFKKAVLSAQGQGVNCIVYMNSYQWGDSSESWKTENAMPYSVKDIKGNMRSRSYNIFTGNSLTNMCMATEFWRNKYASLSDSVVNTYLANGVYMDQACQNRRCYDKTHGHDLGGGNYWVEGFANLTRQIRSKISDKKQIMLAGEGSGESWMPYLDAFLTLPVSRERYMGINSYIETIPFFQAVYHEYAITYGNYSSLVTPPYDNLWPKEFTPKNTEQLLDEKFNKQFLMEQARSFVSGMQPTIANYHSFLGTDRKQEIDYLLDIARIRNHVLDYLLYGEFCRNPKMNCPEEVIDLSKLSIYAGREGKSVTSFQKKVPVLYAGTWKANGKNIGIALASISNNPIPVDFSFSANDYGLTDTGNIYLINSEGRELLTSYTSGEIHLNFELSPRGLCFVEIVPQK